MVLFLSTFEHKVDSKGRVSVPSHFRNVLCGQNFSGVVLYESSINQCIEGCSIDRIQKLSEAIDDLDPFSRERDAFATTILGGAAQLPFDNDGRIILPKMLMEFANVKDNVIFVGKGQTFEIWEPQLFANYAVLAREKAKSIPFLIKK